MNKTQIAGYQVQQTINSAGTWEKKVVTIPGDTSCFDFWHMKMEHFVLILFIVQLVLMPLEL